MNDKEIELHDLKDCGWGLNNKINSSYINADIIPASSINFDLAYYDVKIETKDNQLIITYEKKDI